MLYYIILVCALSGFIGFMLKGYLLGRQSKYVGNIVVTKHDGVTLFSLEMDGNPEELALEKEVTFKILIPEEESNRE